MSCSTVLRSLLLAALLALPAAAQQPVGSFDFQVSSPPAYAAQTWTFDVTTTGNDIHWTSPTNVAPNSVGYDTAIDVTLAHVTVSWLGIPFGPFDVLAQLPPEATYVEGNAAGPAPIGISNLSVLAPPPPDPVAVAGDLSSGLNAAGFGYLDFVNVTLGTYTVNLGFPFGTVTTTITSIRVAGTIEVSETQWVQLGGALAGFGGVAPLLHGTGDLLGNDPFTLRLRNARPLSSATLVLGLSLLGAPFKGGVLVPQLDLLVGGLPLDGAGALDVTMVWPPGVPAGVTTWWQYWIVDPDGPAGFSASNGLSGTTP